MVRIRRFNPDKDLLDIAKLSNKALNEDYKLSMFVNVHEAWPDGFLIAESMGTYIGTVLAVITEPTVARILVLAVDEPYRQKGIAGQLLKSFIQRAVLRGIERLTLEVRISNVAAIRFYKKNRFEIVSTIPVYYRDGEDAYVIVRRL
ncbi:MAG: GNAT family N-acetyltransferase [Thermoplasmata archaeon]|nr:MAG: GNAT family N-acetyltransferase [Thermoplasmata archaeon]